VRRCLVRRLTSRRLSIRAPHHFESHRDGTESVRFLSPKMVASVVAESRVDTRKRAAPLTASLPTRECMLEKMPAIVLHDRDVTVDSQAENTRCFAYALIPSSSLTQYLGPGRRWRSRYQPTFDLILTYDSHVTNVGYRSR